jgi:hypothetical protein
MSVVIFQPTDLVGSKRRAFLDAAKAGRARLRDSDGTSIVALPEAELDALDLVATWSAEHHRLVTLLAKNRLLTVLDLDSLAWLHVLDRDDQQAFADELQEALVLAMSMHDGAPVRDAVHAWRVTASELADPVRREVLLGRFDERNFLDAGHDLDDDAEPDAM